METNKIQKESEWNDCKSVRWTVENEDILCAGELSIDWRNKLLHLRGLEPESVANRRLCTVQRWKKAVNPVCSLWHSFCSVFHFGLTFFHFDYFQTTCALHRSLQRFHEEKKKKNTVNLATVSFSLICYCTSCVQHIGAQQFNCPAACTREYALNTEEEKRQVSRWRKCFFLCVQQCCVDNLHGVCCYCVCSARATRRRRVKISKPFERGNKNRRPDANESKSIK